MKDSANQVFRQGHTHLRGKATAPGSGRTPRGDPCCPSDGGLCDGVIGGGRGGEGTIKDEEVRKRELEGLTMTWTGQDKQEPATQDREGRGHIACRIAFTAPWTAGRNREEHVETTGPGPPVWAFRAVPVGLLFRPSCSHRGHLRPSLPAPVFLPPPLPPSVSKSSASSFLSAHFILLPAFLWRAESEATVNTYPKADQTP